MNRTVSIAIDGPSAAGKSTIAKAISEKLGFLYIDTGALYRAIGCYALAQGADTKEAAQVIPLLCRIAVSLRHVEGTQRVFLNGEDVSEKIRLPEMSMAASNVSAIPEVRAFLLELQRELAQKHNVVMDGRDIATVVLPNADIKFFLTASPEERARRRSREYEQKGIAVDFQTLLAEIIERDFNDSTREIAPLRPAAESIVVDSTSTNFEDTLMLMLDIVREKL